MSSQSSHRLRLNDTILSAGDGDTGDEAGTWWFDVYGADFTTGAAEPLDVTMRTLLQDGARVVTQGYGNREASFYVVVGGVNSSALAAAEKVLALQLGRRGELGWTPPDGWGPETVFDVETSSMTPGGPDDDDLVEVQRNERVYQLQFVCQPFVRTAAAVVVPALGTPAVALDEDVVDAGTSTAGWTARIGNLQDLGTCLNIDGSLTPRVFFTPAAPVDLTTQPYISLVATGPTPYCDVNGIRATLVGSASASLSVGADDLAATRWFWRTEETSATKIEFGENFTNYYGGFVFNDLRIRNLPPFSGTLRQSRRSIEVDGSTRTQGTLELAAPEGEALGTVVFYSTTRSINAPSLRDYAVVGGGNDPFADPEAVSGFVEFLGTAALFDVPVSAITPGKTQILARLAKPIGSSSTTSTVTWSAQTKVGGVAVGPAVTGTSTSTIATNEFKVIALGTADLPPVDLPPESQAIIEISLIGGHYLDEAWLLNLDVGAVTVVEAGAHQRVWIETATTERPRPAIYVGDNADRTDAFHNPAIVGAWGTHEFGPPLTNVLVVTGDCASPDVAFKYYPRFMNFVADPT